MKLILILLVVLATLAGNLKANEDGQDSVFVRIFNNLHRGPPISTSPSSRISSANVQTLWIEQKLDNFDEAENRTWQMRYMSNDEFYQEGAPLFIFVGGEWEISSDPINSGKHFYDMAREHNGYMFYTEHRYYGESRPTADLSSENLKYLNVLQALADLAQFIRTMKSTIPGMFNSKVILGGCSYSGAMVTWFKKLYPDLATGAWASSAPLLAKVNLVEYHEVIRESIRLVGGEDCSNRIYNGAAAIEGLFAKKRGAEVKAMLKVCGNFDESNALDIWSLFSMISSMFNHLVRTDIQTGCRSIMAGEDDISGVASYILSKLGRTNTCFDLSHKKKMTTISNSTYDYNERQWIYQTCNEFGWGTISSPMAQLFGTTFPHYSTICAEAYGDKFTDEFINNQINRTNEMFGGITPQVKNVYSTHGALDPWSALGIAKDQATIIPLYGHCMDLESISPGDSPEMRASKERIAALVREWVGVPTANITKLRKL